MTGRAAFFFEMIVCLCLRIALSKPHCRAVRRRMRRIYPAGAAAHARFHSPLKCAQIYPSSSGAEELSCLLYCDGDTPYILRNAREKLNSSG